MSLNWNIQDIKDCENRFVDKVANEIIKTIDLLDKEPESNSATSEGESRPSTPEEGATP